VIIIVKIILWTLLCFSFPVDANNPPLIAAASSTQFVLEELRHEFNKQTGLKINISYGSSGNFSRQLIQGAPFELFISADEHYISMLHKHHITLNDGVIYAAGRLALFIPHNSVIKGDKKLAGLKEALNYQQVQRFAIANPQHAPYGRAAKDLLTRARLWKTIQSSLVMGENASQAAQYASSGLTEGGIIPYSYALYPAIQQLGRAILLPQSLHAPFYARMVLIKTAGSVAKMFYHFLQSKKARYIFDRHGFLMPE